MFVPKWYVKRKGLCSESVHWFIWSKMAFECVKAINHDPSIMAWRRKMWGELYCIWTVVFVL